jgi:hypothetical protein
MPTSTANRFLSIAAAAFVVSLLAGCAHEKGQEMSPEESKESMIALVDMTIDTVGTSNWHRLSGGPHIQECDLPDGGTGVNFAYTTMGQASTRPEDAVSSVLELWNDKGLSTKVVRSTNPKDTTIRLYGFGGPVKDIDLYADEVATSIGSQSLCIPGDFDRLVSGSGD